MRVADLGRTSLKIKNYKSFGATEHGYEGIRPINLIIGRNNTGKSTLLDLVAYATEPTNLRSLGHRREEPQVTVSDRLREDALRAIYQENTGGGSIGGNHWEYGRSWIGKPITWILEPDNKLSFVATDPPIRVPDHLTHHSLAEKNQNPFAAYIFKKLLADRDIIPEQEGLGETIDPNGSGATRTIHHFINRVGLPSELVEENLLDELNEIFEPDGTFTDIVVQQRNDERWELYLQEEEKGRVPLSHTGSGMKTVLLVLSFIRLIPHIENRPLTDYLFGFEELENNLHPALQRRLLLFLRKVAVEEGCRFFLTTHSNVAIDLFANDRASQIIHVTHNRQEASVRSVTTYVDNRGILDDLDVRASDLLQSNGVVWVEGPSDRLYFNRWMELYSDGKVREGAHYQCVFYGGRLLNRLSAKDPDVDEDEVVKILRVNRNALVLMDSDRQNKDQRLNKTKKRIISEIKKYGDLAWVTAGKEVENYIPHEALQALYPSANPPTPGQYEDFKAYLNGVKRNEGEEYSRNKILFAERVIPHISIESLSEVLDLETKISAAHSRILNWNGIHSG